MNNNASTLPVVKSISDDMDSTQLLLKPIASIDSIVEAYKEYSLLKTRLLSENDYQIIKGKKYIKKSWFRKLSTAFGISTQVMKENRLNLEWYFVYEITVRAIASNGRYAEACSSCASNERDFSHIENDVRATAQTRASNRAIADLIGSWEISAEEMYTVDTKHATTEQPAMSKVHIYEDDSTDVSGPEDVSGFIHKWNRTYSGSEVMTTKQKSLLVKLIENKYKDEQTRSGLFQRLPFLTKQEAGDAIKKMLGTKEPSYS